MSFLNFKWPEMRPVALELIAQMHAGHARGRFAIPVVDFARVFAPAAPPAELAKATERGDIHFTADQTNGGTFVLAEGERAAFDLGREGLVLRIPARMSGRYSIRPAAFSINFNRGEELEGCRRFLLLVCHRVVAVDVSSERVDVRMPNRIFDLCVEFE
ncbi:MAG: hypothetical protein ABR577_17745 [Pyrinomonadaceae bacterium]